MADYLPQASTTGGQTGHGHEANTLIVKGLIIFAVVLVAVVSIVELSLVYVMKDFSQEEKVLQALAPPKFADDSGPVPGPRLQATPPTDLVKLKEAELRRLNGFGWIDQKNAEATPRARPTETAGKSAGPDVKQDRKP
jgi:hypothetical protein